MDQRNLLAELWDVRSTFTSVRVVGSAYAWGDPPKASARHKHRYLYQVGDPPAGAEPIITLLVHLFESQSS